MSYTELLGQAARLGATDADVYAAVTAATRVVDGNGETTVMDAAGEQWPSPAVCEIASATLRRQYRGW